MLHSFAQTIDLTCPTCRQPFPADLWLIVDVAERWLSQNEQLEVAR